MASRPGQIQLRLGEEAVPGRTVRADILLDIRLDIRKITDVRVERSVQPRISMEH